jgi:UDP-N-acetylmuramoyl-L-alanyl-D-glutamate--2,6-diaminopimelate ligase
VTAAACERPVMTLGALLPGAVPAGFEDRRVTDLCLDSRGIVPGALFLAMPGTREHGLRFAAAAADAGAAAVAWEPADGLDEPRLPDDCAVFPVPGLRARLGTVADRFFGEPSRRVRVVGVTGTNGKTTCTHLVAESLDRLGTAAGVIGTLGSGRVGRLEPSSLTTPDVIAVHRKLAQFADAGLQVAAMEVSSHALDQGRVDGVRYAVAGFTNLSRDHLDYHPTLDAYAKSKALLFLAHAPAVSVINVTDAFGAELFRRLPPGARRLAIRGVASDRDDNSEQVRVTSVEALEDGLALRLSGRFGELGLRSHLVGDFNAENIALSFGILLSLDVPPAEAADALGSVRAPAGRMEAFADADREVLVVVDYAHTPDALGKALAALRIHCRGRLWCVFGCGGDRDRGKRPQMGQIAERLADAMIVTDDNPRTEDGLAIVAEILAGLAEPRKARVVRDRAAAIRAALDGARAGDVVLVAGKGHEEVQIVGQVHRPFSDRKLVAELTRRAA